MARVAPPARVVRDRLEPRARSGSAASMVDIHSHILPGIDDGARSLDESLELCRIAAADGVTRIVATPHVMDYRYPNTRQTMEGPFRDLAEAVGRERLPITLVPGAEVHIAAGLVDRYRGGDLVTYDDNRKYMLFEFPFQNVISGAEEAIYKLRLAGIVPVIAHPERIGYFMDDPSRLRKLISMGCVGQVTGGSLLGSFGERSEKSAWKMLELGLVHVVASDGHDAKHRRPVMKDARAAVAARAGEEAAKRMTEEVPAAIVEGRDIEWPEPASEPARAKGFFSRLFSRS
jgi:protein-tyrosine phosphatase